MKKTLLTLLLSLLYLTTMQAQDLQARQPAVEMADQNLLRLKKGRGPVLQLGVDGLQIVHGSASIVVEKIESIRHYLTTAGPRKQGCKGCSGCFTILRNESLLFST